MSSRRAENARSEVTAINVKYNLKSLASEHLPELFQKTLRQHFAKRDRGDRICQKSAQD